MGNFPAGAIKMQTRLMKAFRKTNTLIVLVVALLGNGQDSQAEFDVGTKANWSLWRTGSSCGPACPGSEAHTIAPLYVRTLARATGNVTIRVIPFADLSDNTDGGKWVWILRPVHRWHSNDIWSFRARIRSTVRREVSQDRWESSV